MGNDNKAERPVVTEVNNRLILQLRTRDIILHYAFKFRLKIGDIGVFPHGLSGLKLWDTNIVLARFAILESARFEGKDVLDLSSGVGIGGIAVRKWTKARQVAMCDYR